MGMFDNVRVGDAAAAALGYYGYSSAKDAMSDYARRAKEGAAEAFSTYGSNLQFKPFTVTTGMGGTTGYGDGQLSMTMSPQEQAMQNMLMQQAQQQYGLAGQDISGRTQDIYGMMRAAQTPEEERNRLAMEERLASQGRLGVQTAQYGGTPEQLAFAKAQQEAQNQAYLGARQAALGEQQQAANLGQSMFTQAYLPQSQMLNMFQQGLAGAQQEQAGRQQYGTAGLESYFKGLDAQLQAELGKSNLTGTYIASLADLFRPTINPKTGEIIKDTGLFGDTTIYNPNATGGKWFGGLF